MSNLTEQNEVINLTHIENHVSPHCIIDGMSASEHVRINALSRMESCYIEKKKQCELLQTEIARLNAIVERQKAEMVVMQAEIDLRKETSGRALTRDDVKRHHGLLEIINNPDNQYVPFYHVAYLIRAALDEVAI